MIIFGLDGVLADIDHRRHFVDEQRVHPDYYRKPCKSCNNGSCHMIDPQFHKITGKEWQPDWQAHNAACDKDKPIAATIDALQTMERFYEVHIWSGRCESVREKSEAWLNDHRIVTRALKMRPVGDDTPAHKLKEKWMDEYLNTPSFDNEKFKKQSDLRTCVKPYKVDFVFEADPQSIAMYRRRGIFVFDCSQER